MIQRQNLRMSVENEAKDADYIRMLADSKGGMHHLRRKDAGSSSEPTIKTVTLRSSGKLAAGLGRNPPAKPTARRQLDPIQKQVMQDELNAKRRVYKLRNDLQHSRSTEAMMSMLAKREEKAQRVRDETLYLQGAHLSGSVKEILPASDEQVAFVATALMKQLAINEPEPSKRSWFKLFKEYDENGDGHISFVEVRPQHSLLHALTAPRRSPHVPPCFAQLMQMIRVNIKMPKEVISDDAVRGVWHSIDLDGNGWIDAGEFGRFFRQGEKPMQKTRRRKAEKERQAIAEANKPEFREPTLAEVAIEKTQISKARLESEELQLRQQLRRSASSISAHTLPAAATRAELCLPLVASNKSLPPLH